MFKFIGMLKIKYTLTILFLLIFAFFTPAISYAKEKSYSHLNDEDIQIKSRSNGLIASVVGYLIRPLLIERLDHIINNSNILDRFKIIKFDNRLIKLIDTKIGEGKAVKCGQKVKLKIKAMSADKVLYEKDSYVGEVGSFANRALNLGVIGMRENGKRIIRVPLSVLYRLTNEEMLDAHVDYHIELLESTDIYPAEIEDIITLNDGTNGKKAAMCGDKVKVRYTIRDLQNREVKTNTEDFKIGSKALPPAIELSAIEMQPFSKRTVVAPPKTLIPYISESPEETAKIVEMHLIEVK